MILSGILGEIADAAGEPAARLLAESKGGTTIWIPAEVDSEHWLVEVVGLTAAQKIVRHFRVLDAEGRAKGVRLTIPIGSMGVLRQARRRLAKALEAGKDPAIAAQEAGLHERTAYRMKARMRRGNDDQGELF